MTETTRVEEQIEMEVEVKEEEEEEEEGGGGERKEENTQGPIQEMQEMPDRLRKSAGSASRGTKPTPYWVIKSARIRLGLIDKDKIPPPAEEMEDDVNKRFNGNEEAKKAYQEISKRLLILDKGFEEDFLDHPTIAAWVALNGWNNFAKHDTRDSYWELVREFFANMNGNPMGTTWIRGTIVKYDKKTINELYDLEEFPGGVDFKELNKRAAGTRVGSDRITKIFTKDGSGPKFVTDRTLKVEMAPTVDFYHGKIRPTGNTHAFTQITLKGVADLWQGKRFNVGEIIERTLHGKKDGKGVLCYPNLIRRLCENSGVDLQPFQSGQMIELDGSLQLPELPEDTHADPVINAEYPPESGEQSATRTTKAPARKRKRESCPIQESKKKAQQSTKDTTTPSDLRTDQTSTQQMKELMAQVVSEQLQNWELTRGGTVEKDLKEVVNRNTEALNLCAEVNKKMEEKGEEEQRRTEQMNQLLLLALSELIGIAKASKFPPPPPPEGGEK